MTSKPKYLAKIENVYFLARLGATLRWATRDIVREELPKDVRRALRRLDRIETAKIALRQRSGY